MDTNIPWQIALAVIFFWIFRKALTVPFFNVSATCLLGSVYYSCYREGYRPLHSFISDLITVALLLVIGYYLLKYYLAVQTRRGTVEGQDTQPQQPSSSMATSEQNDSQVANPIDSQVLASVEHKDCGSGPTLVFRCPSDSEEDTEDDMETVKQPHTMGEFPAWSRVFKEMRHENELIKAANVMLTNKQRLTVKQAKASDRKTARMDQKARADIFAEEQAKEMEIRLREATNGTELARLRILYDRTTGDVNSAYKQLRDQETEARTDKALIRTLENEVERAKADETERLDSERRLEYERSLERKQEADKLGSLQEFSNKELEKLRGEIQTLKSAAAMETQKLSQDMKTMKKRLENKLGEVTKELETTKSRAESLQSQLDNKEAEEADSSRQLKEQAMQLTEAKSKVTLLQSELDRKKAEEADASCQLREQAKQLMDANSRVTLLQSQLDEQTVNDDVMVDTPATHVCDHGHCQQRIDFFQTEADKHSKRVQVLEPEIGRLETSHNGKNATLKRQLQDATQARDAAYTNVTALKKEKRDLEDRLRKSDGEVNEGVAEMARLSHQIQVQQDIAKASREVHAAPKSCGGNLPTTKVGGGGRRKREEDEEQDERPVTEAHAQKVETAGPTTKHIKGPEPKAVAEAAVKAPSRDLLKGKLGREVGNQIEKWFGIMGEAKQPGQFSSALQTWMKFLMENFDDLLNACQTVAVHLSMIAVVNLQDHGLMLFAHHIKDFVQYCLQTGIWDPEKQGKMKSVEKYAQMILKYGVEAGADFRDCKDPTTFYHRR